MNVVQGLFKDLSGQAAHWQQVQVDFTKTQASLQSKLVESMSQSVAKGIVQISDKMAAHLQAQGRKTVENQTQLASLIEQTQGQARSLSVLEEKVTTALDRLSKPQPVQIAQTVCLAGILVALILQLMGVGA